MRTHLAVALLSTLTSLSAAAQSPSVAESAVRSLQAADSAWNQASLARSVERMMSFYASNATADLGPGKPSRGIDAIRRLWTSAYTDSSYRLGWVMSRAEVVADSDLAYTTGTWRLTTRANGEQSGTYFAVWQRQADGRWLVLIDTAR